ncbi:TetR/AcrR family transcriptional regulator [Nocardia vinacea]|uniref:TetR/AcrR family transcriptional regulator n=1 Tax=Nocardia vinacea TaxID=96468 RepID=UPI0003190E7E|nr:TetR/AcrR family transcriptional regulator [Nocardia vinacea]
MAVLDKRTRDDPRRRATELAFLHATEALLNEGGSYADLAVSRIAERAGRTRTAFYAHFEDRRELLLALVEEVGGEAFAAIEPFLAVDGPVEYDQLTASTAGLVATFRDHATLLRAVIEAAGYDERIAAYWDGVLGRFVDAARERLRAEGFGEAEAAATAAALIWMTERMCYQQAVRGGTGLDDPAAVAGISDVWWSVLCAARTGALRQR